MMIRTRTVAAVLAAAAIVALAGPAQAAGQTVTLSGQGSSSHRDPRSISVDVTGDAASAQGQVTYTGESGSASCLVASRNRRTDYVLVGGSFNTPYAGIYPNFVLLVAARHGRDHYTILTTFEDPANYCTSAALSTLIASTTTGGNWLPVRKGDMRVTRS